MKQKLILTVSAKRNGCRSDNLNVGELLLSDFFIIMSLITTQKRRISL